MSASDRESENGTNISSPRPMSIQSLDDEVNHSIEVNMLDNTVMTTINIIARENIKSYENPGIIDDNSSERHDIIVEEIKEGDFSFG
jgi:hypothetical protein